MRTFAATEHSPLAHLHSNSGCSWWPTQGNPARPNWQAYPNLLRVRERIVSGTRHEPCSANFWRRPKLSPRTASSLLLMFSITKPRKTFPVITERILSGMRELEDCTNHYATDHSLPIFEAARNSVLVWGHLDSSGSLQPKSRRLHKPWKRACHLWWVRYSITHIALINWPWSANCWSKWALRIRTSSSSLLKFTRNLRTPFWAILARISPMMC